MEAGMGLILNLPTEAIPMLLAMVEMGIQTVMDLMDTATGMALKTQQKIPTENLQVKILIRVICPIKFE